MALGFFDGVHLGHREIISEAVDYARSRALVPAVLTFDKHPRSLTAGKAPLLITSLEQRLELFASLGIETTVLLEFNEALMQVSAEEYLERYLVNLLNAQYISVGFDHHFGKGRSGTPELLDSWGRKRGVGINIIERVTNGGLTVSSSTIRSLLHAGDMAAVNKLLGRSYSLTGSVVHGDGRGRELGFPTANIAVNPELILPGFGVYIVDAKRHSERSEGSPCDDKGIVTATALPHDDVRLGAGLVNIGCRPTFKSTNEVTVELYLPEQNLDLYGSTIKLEFKAKLRDEFKFEGAEQLIRQIELDLKAFKKYQAG